MRFLVVIPFAAFLLAAGCVPVSAGVRTQHPLLRLQRDDGALASSSVMKPLFDSPIPDDESDEARDRIAAAAGSVVGRSSMIVGGERFRFDCSGVARGIYAKAGYPLGSVVVTGQRNDTRVLFELVRANGSLRRARPLVGDLVFFDDTWDENGNGMMDDSLSHVGVVERVEDDGTVVFVHRIGNRIARARLNLSRPHDRFDEHGASLNHWLRAEASGRPAATTGELFVAFGSLPLSRPSSSRTVAMR